ncbi:hypothetical protein [Tistrella mobilis]|uniref:hypothetical protein n=1 Tax=Tistrella mobilis TaxID=171437 RepID=UPI0005A0B6B8|nr:hypothetical protein [Tistrella mobilis]
MTEAEDWAAVLVWVKKMPLSPTDCATTAVALAAVVAMVWFWVVIETAPPFRLLPPPPIFPRP